MNSTASCTSGGPCNCGAICNCGPSCSCARSGAGFASANIAPQRLLNGTTRLVLSPTTATGAVGVDNQGLLLRSGSDAFNVRAVIDVFRPRSVAVSTVSQISARIVLTDTVTGATSVLREGGVTVLPGGRTMMVLEGIVRKSQESSVKASLVVGCDGRVVVSGGSFVGVKL